uniref:Uncharacterized protein n=1 Tax=Magnetococcus massalia (strain MO-1) TaxID=451514 RepID=A0A1S7LMM1_MAGMO|nr:conserved protein of unknown function [Candidatus Magnetococcus massalia]
MTCLLKWEHQPENRTLTWRLAISNLRNQVEDLIEDSEEDLYERMNMDDLYSQVKPAVMSSGIPSDCPYTLEDLVDPYFWPDE